MKPSLFIGSSTEAKKVAEAIQDNLSAEIDCTVWDQGPFELSETYIESLEKSLNTYDYAIFIFNPDDKTEQRGIEQPSVRDNVLFELGLFIRKLGRKKVFFIIPENSKVKIPSDISNLTIGRYNPQRKDNNLKSATAPFCRQVKEKVCNDLKENKNHEIPERQKPNAPEEIEHQIYHHNEDASTLDSLYKIFKQIENKTANYEDCILKISSSHKIESSFLKLKTHKLWKNGYINLILYPSENGPCQHIKITDKGIDYLSINEILIAKI